VFLEVPAPLVELERFFQRSSVWDSLDDPMIHLLLDFLARNLFEQLPSISPHHCCSSIISVLQATHRHTVAALHNIGSLALRHLSLSYTEEWVRTQLLRCFVAGLGSPDELEVSSLKKLLDSACEVVPEVRSRVFRLVRDRLSLSSLLPYPSIANYLTFIHGHLRTALEELPEIQWFSAAVLPLFASPFLPAFHFELEQLCSLVIGYCEEAAAIAARYLLRHWPVTSSAKIPLFLESLGRAVSVLGTDQRRVVAQAVFARITEAIEFGHPAVVTGALRLLEDPRFLALFDAADAAPVYTAVATIAAGASPVRAQAVNVLAAVAKKCDGAAVERSEETVESIRDERWKIVIEAAGEAAAV
jgi:hypothetical protein